MGKLISIWNKVEENLIVLIMAGMATIVFAQIVFRTLKMSLSWSEELARYLTIWISFVGSSYAFRRGSHIGVEAVKNLFPVNARRIIEFLGYIVSIILSVLVAMFGRSIVQTQLKFTQVSPAMRIPMWVIYYSIPIGFGLCALRNVELAVELLLKKSDTVHDEELKAGNLKEESEEMYG